MYLSLGTEGRQVLNSKNSTTNLDEIPTRNLWDILNKTFIRVHNITFDRYLFLTQKQQKGEPIEKFYGLLKELSENCDLGEKLITIIRDVFIANMQNEDIQKELLKETVEPDKALAIAINIEMGTLNQLKMTASKSELNSTFNQIQRMRIANATPFSNMNTTARKKPTTCHFCGMNWTSEHQNICPARGKKCNNCGIENHFAKVYRKPKDPGSYPKPRPRVNNVEKMIRRIMLIKFRKISTLIWNQTTLRMKITALHQYLQQTLQVLWKQLISLWYSEIQQQMFWWIRAAFAR